MPLNTTSDDLGDDVLAESDVTADAATTIYQSAVVLILGLLCVAVVAGFAVGLIIAIGYGATSMRSVTP